jgi:HK97 gp10 family phage protein
MAYTSPVRVKIGGAKELQDALLALGPKVARKLCVRALKDAAKVIIDAAQPHIPVSDMDHPHLEDSLRVRVSNAHKDNERTVFVGFLEPAARYAHLVEFGSSRIKPQPFMRPAIDARGAQCIDLIQAELWEDIEAEVAAGPRYVGSI